MPKSITIDEQKKKEEQIKQAIPGASIDFPVTPNNPFFPTPQEKSRIEQTPVPKPGLNVDRIVTNPPKGNIEVFRDKEGSPSGVQLPDGRVFLGLNPEDVAQIAQAEKEKTQLPENAQPIGTQQKIQQTNRAVQQVVTGEQPQLRQLNPAENVIEKIPILGRMSAVVSNIIGGKTGIVPPKNIKEFFKPEFEPANTPEQLRNQALTIIEQQVYEKGVDANDKFGAFIEAIPIVGSLVNTYARGLISTPKGSVDDITREVLNQGKLAAEQQKIAKLSPELRQNAFNNVEDIELNIQRLESRIKLLSIFSAELRANPEQLDIIEEKILLTRQRLIRIKAGIVQGVDVAPEDAQLLSTLENL